MASSALKKNTSDEKEKYQRFDRIAELFTYIAVVVGVLLTFLPYQFPFDRFALYKLMAFVVVFCVIWFRLVPKKFSGFFKTLIYYVVSIVFVGVAVHFTNGIESFAIFLFYLTVITAAAGLDLIYFLSMVVLVGAFFLVEAYYFGAGQAPLQDRTNLVLVHLWALLIVATYSRYIFGQQARAESGEKSSAFKNATQIDMVKNEFVFVISNKLKEPILTLQNFLETAEKNMAPSASKDLKDLLGKTIENSGRLSALVNDLSDLSRIESQELRLDLKPVVLSQIITSTMSDFSMTATEKGISLNYKPNKEELTVLADSSRLHEILANLIDNAIKYSDGQGSIDVWFEKNNSEARVAVKDTGFGIPDEAKDHLFEKFYRVNRSSSEPKGTGLGLFVTKELVQRQGGKIWFESKVGAGTTFYFTLPLFSKSD